MSTFISISVPTEKDGNMLNDDDVGISHYLVGATFLIFSQQFQTGAESHKGLINVACFPQAVSSISCSVSSLTACQVHKRKLADINLLWILLELKKIFV